MRSLFFVEQKQHPDFDALNRGLNKFAAARLTEHFDIKWTKYIIFINVAVS